MGLKWQILIPTTPDRDELTDRLVTKLAHQIHDGGFAGQVEYFTYSTPMGQPSIGAKRNECIDQSTAEYISFFDSDDLPSSTYVKNNMDGISKGVDACSLRGVITWDGQNPEIFEHSIKYSEWKTNTTGEIKYERNTNHLNVIKREIAQQFKFPETNFGEDHNWSQQLHGSGLIKTEHFIDEVIYNYCYTQNK